ncbi:MAG: hypothetical protein ACKO37_02900 [Vampirovibrionales bacterium]
MFSSSMSTSFVINPNQVLKKAHHLKTLHRQSYEVRLPSELKNHVEKKSDASLVQKSASDFYQASYKAALAGHPYEAGILENFATVYQLLMQRRQALLKPPKA